MLYALGRGFFWVVFRIFFRFRAEGREHIPARGPLILAANHVSYLDPPLLGAATPRPVHFMAKQELFEIPVLHWVMPRVRAFPVRRGTLDREAIRQALNLLEQGHVIGLFPEGTRRREGGPLPGQQGVAMLAARSGAPIVPVGLIGTRRWLSTRPFPWPTRFVVRIGAPIWPDSQAGSKKEQWERLVHTVMQAIGELTGVEGR